MRLAPEGAPQPRKQGPAGWSKCPQEKQGKSAARESRVGLRVPEAGLHLVFWPPNPQGPRALLVWLQAGWNRAPSATPGLTGGPCTPGAIPSHQGRA